MSSLLRHLRTRLEGDITDDAGMRALYATDASNHRVVPRLVARPADADDVAEIVAACAAEGVPVTSRGAGTNCAGNAVGPGVVLDLSHAMDRVLDVDVEARTAVVQPGVVLDRLQEAVGPGGLLFGVDPSTHSRCTLGGMIGTNACGAHSVAWGTTADNVVSLDVVLPDGSRTSLGPAGARAPDLQARLVAVRDRHLAEIRTELGRFPRQISGYGLQYLLPERGTDVAKAFVGSEGTCAVVTAATVRLHERPALRQLLVFGFASEVDAALAAPQVTATGPLTVEGMDEEVVATADLRARDVRRPELPAGRAWLLVEVGGSDAVTRDAAAALAGMVDELGAQEVRVYADPAQQRAVWAIRERGAGLASRSVDGVEFWPGWEDAAVPPAALGDYLRDFRRLMAEHGRSGMVYGHFGEGCVHVRIDHDLLTEAGRVRYRAFQEDAADLVIGHHGSLSGEHGDGRARSELLGRMYGERVLAAFGAFKQAFDPERLMNPGVLVDPDPLDGHLRQERSAPYRKDLALLYPDDDGDLAKALRRCTGVGACRKTSGGAMCPSYRATGEERNSTRGRARLLAEMLDGELLPERWDSDAVHEALDMCLSCKACSAECPVGVDMATYKSEFLHQRYRRRLRPRSHYSMGWLPLALAIGRRIPRLANRLLSVPGAEPLARRLAGIDRRRSLPRLATGSARRRLRSRGPGAGAAPADRVLLWVDTFTSSFDPGIARDAVRVLEHAGYDVELAPRGICCGLTWVSTGQLGVARRVLSRTVRLLDRTPVEVPVVALEPSCGAALRHDSRNLLAGAAVERVAGRVRSLAEVLADRPLPAEPPAAVEAVAQFHCHQRATSGTDADLRVLASAGVTVRAVDEGCCGLAGNFGFEDGHYDVSVACAEEALLPALRAHPADGPVLADGFSCRIQVEQLAGRRAVHLAELLARRLDADS